MVLADEVVRRLSVGPGIGIIDPNEVEIAIQKGQRRDRVFEEAFEHLPALFQFALDLHPPCYLTTQVTRGGRQLRGARSHLLAQTIVPSAQLRFHLLSPGDVPRDSRQVHGPAFPILLHDKVVRQPAVLLVLAPEPVF